MGAHQSLGVFIDTIVVCTATAFVIHRWVPGVGRRRRGSDGDLAVANELGAWTIVPWRSTVFVLAYSLGDRGLLPPANMSLRVW